MNEIRITKDGEALLWKSDVGKKYYENGRAWTVALKDDKLQWERMPSQDAQRFKH